MIGNCNTYPNRWDYGGANYFYEHQDFPWEDKYQRLNDLLLDFKRVFHQSFRGGRIPHKGYGGPQLSPQPPHVPITPAPVDMRRDIRYITTPRPSRVP